MSNKGIVFLSLATTLLFNLSLFSQEKELGTEVVNIVKPYSPTISDAFKVKETPRLLDSTSTQKKKVKYTIFSVPVASTFTPVKGTASNIQKPKREKTYDNYATLGFGNYTTILGELYSNFEISRTDNVGFFFRHNSSQGDIKGVKLDNKFYDTSLDATYTSRQRDATYSLDFGLEHQLFNWYGLNEEYQTYSEAVLDGIDPKHSYFSGYLGGSMAFDNSIFEKAALNVRYLGDSFSSSEINAVLKPEFTIPFEGLNLKVDGDIDYLAGSFDRDYFNTGGIKYSILNAGLAPSLSYVDDNLSVSLGVAGYVSMDTENSETEFSLFPRLKASYRLLDESVIIYGGAEGGLEQNSYYNFKEQNPFVSPTLLYVLPTKNIYEGFAGIKGMVSNSVGYNLRASYGQDESKAFFQANQLKTLATGLEGYEYGNSFNVVYDDLNTLEIFGELQFSVSKMLSLGVNANYFNYKTDLQEHAWNLPEFKATLFSNFNITEQLYGGVSIFYVGERNDLVLDAYPFSEVVTLDGYVDANIHFGYRFTERLSAFAKGSNLFSDNYTKWMNYPVQGIQVLVGATYKFDW